MLHVKDSTVGIDTPIQAFQTYLYDKLKVLWPVDDSTLEGYGRVFRNRGDKGYVPELFVGSDDTNNTKYQAVYFDKTTLKAMFFFDAEDKVIKRDLTFEQGVGIIFIVNLELLNGPDTTADLTHRGDEEVRNEIRMIMQDGKFQTTYEGEETGYRNVFSRYDGVNSKDTEVFEDRHPLHCFKMNMLFMFNPARNCFSNSFKIK